MATVQVPVSVAGGMNDAVTETDLLADECSLVQNRDYSESPEGETRQGHSKYNSTRFKDASSRVFRILGLTSFGYGFSSGAQTFRDIFVGKPTSGGAMELRYVTAGAGTQIEWATGFTPGTSLWPFNFATVGNRLLGSNGEMMFSWNGDAARKAQTLGIPTAPTAPTVAAGAGTNLTGTYRWLVVYVDSTDDVRSAAGTISASLSLSGQGAALSAIPVSGNARVNFKEIYRTKNTGAAPYFLVGTIAAATTTFADNVADFQLTTMLDAGGAPPACRFLVPYNGVVYGMNNPSGENYSTVYPSLPRRWEEFPASYAFELGGPDGQQITGAFVVGNQLIVMREHSVWHITGTNNKDRNFQEISSSVGMKWPFAGVQVANMIMFAGEDGIYVYDTATITKVKNERDIFPMQGTWDNIGNLEPSNSFGNEMRLWWHSARQQLLAAYREDPDSGPNTRCLVWNTQAARKSWSKYTFGFDAIGQWRANFSNKPTTVFATEDADGYVFKLDTGNVDRADSAGTLTGTATAGAVTSITDSAATFDTTGEGLIGAYVWVRSATTSAEQTVKIVSNTGTKLTVSAWPTFTPASGDTYAVGSILDEFKTGRLDFEKPEIEKELLEAEMRLGSAA